jgi:hypothetical protein
LKRTALGLQQALIEKGFDAVLIGYSEPPSVNICFNTKHSSVVVKLSIDPWTKAMLYVEFMFKDMETFACLSNPNDVDYIMSEMIYMISDESELKGN